MTKYRQNEQMPILRDASQNEARASTGQSIHLVRCCCGQSLARVNEIYGRAVCSRLTGDIS